jgi:hypothetical protein
VQEEYFVQAENKVVQVEQAPEVEEKVAQMNKMVGQVEE